jgi:hypothetical protein
VNDDLEQDDEDEGREKEEREAREKMITLQILRKAEALLWNSKRERERREKREERI